MQTKLKNQKWTCVHDSQCNCSLHEIYIGPNQTISLFYSKSGERSKIIEKDRHKTNEEKTRYPQPLHGFVIVSRVQIQNMETIFFLLFTPYFILNRSFDYDDAEQSQLDYYYRFIIILAKKSPFDAFDCVFVCDSQMLKLMMYIGKKLVTKSNSGNDYLLCICVCFRTCLRLMETQSNPLPLHTKGDNRFFHCVFLRSHRKLI